MAEASNGSQRRNVTFSQSLLTGEKVIKWDEDADVATPVTLKVDRDGFFLSWHDDRISFLEISMIRDTRTGKYAKTPKKEFVKWCANFGSDDAFEDKTVTVCYGTDYVDVKFISFSFGKKEVAELWCNELLRASYNLLAQNASVESYLRKNHTRFHLSVDRSGSIPISTVSSVYASHEQDIRLVLRALKLAGIIKSTSTASISPNKLTFERFYNFYRILTYRSDVEQIFAKLCDCKNYMTVEDFETVINTVQRDSRLSRPLTNKEKVRRMVVKFEPSLPHAKRGLLSKDGFLRYLISDENLPIHKDHLGLCHDMKQPLAHYFISSSHNTYLTGHQLTSRASVEMYRQVLLAGCRCIELDLWDGAEGEPVITHGYTFVKEIKAKEAIEAVAESAFKTSDFPVILSFENHCSKKNQSKISQYCKEAFGEMLLTNALEGYPLEPGFELPSPWLLKRRILIKNKKKRTEQKSDFHVLTESNWKENDYYEVGSDSESGEEVSDDEMSNKSFDFDKDTAAKEMKAGSEISTLVTYVEPVHFRSFADATMRQRYYEMSSFVESRALALFKEQPIEFVNYNKLQLSRIYPKGTRVDSSNFLPHLFWAAGVQLVALNFQCPDVPVQLNQALFEYNNRSGYLLKPTLMRSKDKKFDPLSDAKLDGVVPASVSVKVISGQLLSNRRVNTYVEVEIYGTPGDTYRNDTYHKKFRTKTVLSNGINPSYGNEEFGFPPLAVPELACLRLAVYEDSGCLIGHRVIPVTALCPGYKHITLRNETGYPLSLPTLFVHLTVEDYIPDRFMPFVELISDPLRFESKQEYRNRVLSSLLRASRENEEANSSKCSRSNGSKPSGLNQKM